MIYGERVRLRGMEREDLPHFVDWLNDPEVTKGLALFLPLSQADEERWFEKLADRPPEEKPLAIDVKGGRDWTLAGSSGFHNIEWNNRAAEIGIFIGDKSIWNKGYGTEAVRLLLRHGFETLNLNRIYLRVHGTNQRAIRAYEKAGFILEGRMRQAIYKHGRYEDQLLMSVLRSEWELQK
jgi:RimJ/RimL family protein N-acetyltransferase